MDARFRAACAALAEGKTTGTALDVKIEDVQYFAPTPFAPELVGHVRAEAQARGFSHQDIVTGAGHDAVYIAGVAPTAMIFVPCKDGISHNEVEDARPEHLEAGANVLLGAMVAQAGKGVTNERTQGSRILAGPGAGAADSGTRLYRRPVDQRGRWRDVRLHQPGHRRTTGACGGLRRSGRRPCRGCGPARVRGRVWSAMPRRERKAVLSRLAALIETHREELALLETLDMGKPIGDTMLYDIPEAARTYAWYAEAIDKVYDEIAPTDAGVLATITREPLGVVAAVVPWNYPLLMASWKVAPALAAGNSVVLKPAEQSPLTAIRLAALAEEAGVPHGVFNVVPGLGAEAGQALGRHPDVDCLAFTGSTATGKRFMEYSGQSNLKRVWLECGGKSPHIVFDDCPDLDRAALAAAIGIFNNQGEICIAGSRLYVQRGIYDTFMAKLAHAAAMQPGIRSTRVRDGRDRRRAAVRPRDVVCGSRPEGGRKAACGRSGRARRIRGWFVQPTIFECPTQSLSIVKEEIFGPVLAVTVFDTEAEAVAMANDSAYGLGAGCGRRICRARIVSRAGCVAGWSGSTATWTAISRCRSAASSSRGLAATSRCTRWRSTRT
jgi:gamma-glutamyl-gamma-aminobutyraldehyde dehydrogenase